MNPLDLAGMRFKTTRGTEVEVQRVRRYARGFQVYVREMKKKDLAPGFELLRRLPYVEFRDLCEGLPS